MSLFTHRKIIVEPFKIQHIEKLKILKIPNQHSSLVLTGILPEQVSDTYAKEILDKKTIRVKILESNGEKVVFSGVINEIQIKARSGIYYLEISAVSHSIKTDLEWVRRSYQKLSMTYEDLMKKAVAKFANAQIMDKRTKGAVTGEFILQYDETPWEFVKRMASRFNVPLIVDDVFDTPKIYVGVPDKDEIGNLEDYSYKIKKEASKYRTTIENYKESAFENDFTYFEIYSEKIFEIGNKVKLKNSIFYVKEAKIELADGIFKNVYKVTKKSGFHVNKIKNEKIIGLSLEGEVLDVATDDVKIFLDIDRPHPPDDFCWFKYSTPYTSDNGGGFYCMPEIGEKVRLYLPDWDDELAYSTSCVRVHFETSEERGIPDIKYWRTYAGKELMFTPNGIKIRCLDNEIFINMIVEDGILIQSNKNINVIANEGSDIGLYAEGKIVVAAEEEIDIFCNGSRINMKDGITKIRGDYIKEN